MVIGTWCHNSPCPTRLRRPRPWFASDRLTPEERRRITQKTGRSPEESVTLFLEQIRDGRRLFLEDFPGEDDE